MSGENLKLAHAVIDAVEVRDADALVELTHPEVEWQSKFVVSGTAGGYRGHDGIREYIQDMNDAWGLVRLEVESELWVGDLVVFVGRIQTRGNESGVESETESGYLLKFRDGKLVRFAPFSDPEQKLEAVVG